MNEKIRTLFLNECLSLVIDNRGKTPKKLKTDWVDKGYRTISANNVKFNGLEKEDSIRFLDEKTYKIWMKDEIKKGDLLLTSEAPAGQIMYWNSDEKIIVGQRLFCLRTNDLVDSHYLKYYIQSSTGQFEINKNTTGSTVFGISAKMFEQISIKVPAKEIQKKIATVLSSLDSKIELNNKINAELEAMAKTLYDYWFVQFDFPDSDGKPYKTSGGKMVWNDELKREIPYGFIVKNLDELGCFKNGINYDPSIKGDTEARIINVRNISSSTWFVSQYDLDAIILNEADVNNYLVTDKDILIARSGIPGASRIMYEYVPNTIYCGFIIRYQVNSLKNKNYLFFCLKDLEKSTTSKSAGTIMQNVNQDTLKRIYIAVPTEYVIAKFNELMLPIFANLNNNLKENQTLSELRDWLLPMLMNGQVGVE